MGLQFLMFFSVCLARRFPKSGSCRRISWAKHQELVCVLGTCLGPEWLGESTQSPPGPSATYKVKKTI